MSLIHDEKGKVSSSRSAFWVVLLWAVLLISAESFGWFNVTISGGAYGFIGAALVALVSWAGGARIAQYVGPQISGVASALGRLKGTDNRYTDDERG